MSARNTFVSQTDMHCTHMHTWMHARSHTRLHGQSCIHAHTHSIITSEPNHANNHIQTLWVKHNMHTGISKKKIHRINSMVRDLGQGLLQLQYLSEWFTGFTDVMGCHGSVMQLSPTLVPVDCYLKKDRNDAQTIGAPVQMFTSSGVSIAYLSDLAHPYLATACAPHASKSRQTSTDNAIFNDHYRMLYR